MAISGWAVHVVNEKVLLWLEFDFCKTHTDWYALEILCKRSEQKILFIPAAHCIHPKNLEKPHNYQDIAAVLGRHNIGVGREEGSVTRILSNMVIHPDWNSAEIKYDADLAILVMMRPVEFSSFIQPVCITTEPEIQQYNDGYVVSSKILIIHEQFLKISKLGRLGKERELWKQHKRESSQTGFDPSCQA